MTTLFFSFPFRLRNFLAESAIAKIDANTRIRLRPRLEVMSAIVVIIASAMTDDHEGSNQNRRSTDGMSDSDTDLFGDESVDVKASKIVGAGLGAFALKAFTEGERVGQYRCTVLDGASTTSGVFSWFLNSTHSCDGEAHRFSNPMRYVNSIASLSTCSAQNVVVHPDDRTATVTYAAMRRINVGEELIADYGEAYFKTSSVFGCSGVLYECDAPAMHVASGRGDLEAVRGLLSGRRDSVSDLVNQRSTLELARTPLMEAALGGHESVARVLIDQGADAAGADRKGYTALHIASQHGRHHLVRFLIRSGADASQARPNGDTALIIASREGHLDVVSALIGAGVDVNHANADGATAIIAASYRGHVGVVTALAGASADVNFADADGASALLIAGQEGHLDVVTALAELGADINLPDADGETALFKASYNGHLDIVKALGRAGANVNLATAEGASPLIVAAQKRHLDVVDALIDLAANVNQAAENGATPLIMASMTGHLQIAKLLLSNGANPASTFRGNSAYNLATQRGHLAVAEMISAALEKVDDT